MPRTNWKLNTNERLKSRSGSSRDLPMELGGPPLVGRKKVEEKHRKLILYDDSIKRFGKFYRIANGTLRLPLEL